MWGKVCKALWALQALLDLMCLHDITWSTVQSLITLPCNKKSWTCNSGSVTCTFLATMASSAAANPVQRWAKIWRNVVQKTAWYSSNVTVQDSNCIFHTDCIFHKDGTKYTEYALRNRGFLILSYCIGRLPINNFNMSCGWMGLLKNVRVKDIPSSWLF